MKLTRTERLLLLNQYEIRAALAKAAGDESERRTHEYHAEIVRRGYELLYGELTYWVSDEPLSYDDCKEVLDILDMYEAMLDAWDDAGGALSGRDEPRFRGFCGNTEMPRIGFAHLFCRTDGPENKRRFTRVLQSAPKDLNSHSGSSLDGYRRQLRKWGEMNQKRDLTLDQVEELMKARWA